MLTLKHSTQIQPSRIHGPKMLAKAKGFQPTTIEKGVLDKVELSKQDSKKIMGQRFGAVAALTTQIGTRLGGVAAGVAAGSIGGPLGMVLGGALGLLAANKALKTTKIDKAAAKLANRAGKALVEATNMKPVSPRAWERDLKSGVQIVDKAQFKEFRENLQPGDVLIGSSESNLLFQTITAVTGAGAYNHGMLYAGDGKIVESVSFNRLKNNGVREFDLADKHESYSAWVAIRPKYEEGQAEKAAEFGKAQIGKLYDWTAGMNNGRYGCGELVFDSVKAAAPEMGLKLERFFGVRDYVSPQGLLEIPGAEVVGELGVGRSLIPTYMAQYGGE